MMRGEEDRLGVDVLFRLAEVLGVPTDHYKPFLAPDTVTEGPAAPPAKQKGGGKK